MKLNQIFWNLRLKYYLFLLLYFDPPNYPGKTSSRPRVHGKREKETVKLIIGTVRVNCSVKNEHENNENCTN